MRRPFQPLALGALGAMLAMVPGPTTEAAPPLPLEYPGQADGYIHVKDFRFSTGERLPELKLHFVTLGTPQRDAKGRVTNAVLLLHGTSGTSRQWFQPAMAAELFAPGQPLDPARWYVIIPDGLGRGGSTKPSDGLKGKFPRYGYADVVTAQHLLVTSGLAVDHLRAVIGTSMGGMQAWMWAERFPDFVDAVLPIACQPMAISGRNLLLRRILTEAIRNDPGWNGGDYETQPKGWLATAPLWSTMMDSPASLQAQAPTRAASVALYDRLVEEARKSWDTNDFLYWLESSFDYDPQPGLGKIRAKVIAVNFEDDAINPAELGVVRKLVESVPGARFVLVPTTEQSHGHSSLRQAALWKQYVTELLAPPEQAGAR
jgi:homoserine O-acetyltransferase